MVKKNKDNKEPTKREKSAKEMKSFQRTIMNDPSIISEYKTCPLYNRRADAKTIFDKRGSDAHGINIDQTPKEQRAAFQKHMNRNLRGQ